MNAGIITIDYTNWRGERSKRRVLPIQMKLGANKWHNDVQWLMLAHDIAKGENREFALRNIHQFDCESEVASGGEVGTERAGMQRSRLVGGVRGTAEALPDADA